MDQTESPDEHISNQCLSVFEEFQDLLWLGMIRHTDMKVTVMRNKQEAWHTRGHLGKHRVGQEVEGMRSCGQEPSLWFLWEGTGEAGHTGLGVARLNNSSGSGHRGCCSCPAPGPGVAAAGE